MDGFFFKWFFSVVLSRKRKKNGKFPFILHNKYDIGLNEIFFCRYFGLNIVRWCRFIQWIWIFHISAFLDAPFLSLPPFLPVNEKEKKTHRKRKKKHKKREKNTKEEKNTEKRKKHRKRIKKKHTKTKNRQLSTEQREILPLFKSNLENLANAWLGCLLVCLQTSKINAKNMFRNHNTTLRFNLRFKNSSLSRVAEKSAHALQRERERERDTHIDTKCDGTRVTLNICIQIGCDVCVRV